MVVGRSCGGPSEPFQMTITGYVMTATSSERRPAVAYYILRHRSEWFHDLPLPLEISTALGYVITRIGRIQRNQRRLLSTPLPGG